MCRPVMGPEGPFHGINREQKFTGPLDKVMVNTIQNVETRSQAVASGKDAAQSPATRKIEIENGEGTSNVGRLLRARRNRPLSADMTNHHQINNYIPVLRCKLPLDRIEDILSKIKKTELPTVDKSDNVKSDLSVQTELNSISTTNSDLINNDLMTNVSGGAGEPVERNAPVRIMCLFCDRTFVSNMLLQKHTERSHHISSNRRCSSRNVEQVTAVNFHPGCNFCSKNSNIQTATNLTVLFNHLLDEHGVKYFACRVCQIRFSSGDSLAVHNRDEHGVHVKDGEIALDDRVGDTKRSPNCSSIEKNTPSPYYLQYSSTQFVQPKIKTDCLLANSSESVNAEKESSDDSKADKKSKSLNKKAFTKSRTTTALISYNQKDKHSKQSPVKDSKLLADKSKEFVDIEKNIIASLIMLHKKLSEHSTSNKKINIDQNAVIVLDDINYDNKLFKNKQTTVSNQMNLKPDEKDNQILSRLGIAQNRTSRARSLRRSRKTPLTENRSCSETPRKDKTKVKSEVTDFVINKNKNDPNSKFDPAFYSNVSYNVRENLMKHLDGKLGKQDESPLIHYVIDPKIKSTHAVVQFISTQPSEIHGSDVNLNAITIFPTLLTSDQYGSDKVPHYSYGANAQTFKKIITKNSWKWKWDPIKKYKYCNEDGKIVRKIRSLQHVSPRDLSKLDIWTQLTMREKFDQFVSSAQSDVDLNVERATRSERQKQINELNMILDKRSFPDIESENKRCGPLTNENIEDYDETKNDASDMELCSTLPKNFTENISEPETQSDHSILNNLGLIKKAPEGSSSSNSVLSGEWARPRCYICCICGRRADCLRLLEAHQAAHHHHVNSTYYEIVGQELLDTEVYKYLYLPGAKINQEKNLKNDTNMRSLKKLTQTPINMGRSSRILRTTTRSIKSLEKECTKCKKMLAPSEFYRHILECAGDYGWMMAKKKCKYKPFGARRRRLKGLYKREMPQEEERTEIKDQVVRPKIPPRPRTKPSDAETIQRMLANLPPKRASRQIHDLSSPKSKNIVRERKHHSAHQILNSKANLTRNKISNGNVITSVKNSLAKKVMRLTRSVSNMKHPNLDSQKLENVDKKITNITKNKKIHGNLKKNRGNTSKNDVLPAVSENADEEDNATLKNVPQKLTRRTVISSKHNDNNTPSKNENKIKNNLSTSSQGGDGDSSVSDTIVVSQSEKKNNKKQVNFPLKWIGNKKVHFSKSKKSIKKKARADAAVTTSENSDVLESLENDSFDEFDDDENVKDSTDTNVQCDLNQNKTNMDKASDPSIVEPDHDTTIINDTQKEENISLTAGENDNPIEQNLDKERSTASIVPIATCSNYNFIQNMFNFNNNNSNDEPKKKSGDQNNYQGGNKMSRVINNCTPSCTSRSDSFFIANLTATKKDKPIEDKLIEPIRCPNSAYFVKSANIDKPPLPYPSQNCFNHNQYNMGMNILPHQASYPTSKEAVPFLSKSDASNATSSKQSCKQSKSRKGLNDCIAMLKGKLVEKVSIFPEPPKPPPPPPPPVAAVNVVNTIVEDSQQPLDLSGCIPQPEDLSMKSTSVAMRPQPPPPVVNITPPKPVAKPIYDPILKIPQYSLSTANQRILSKTRTAPNNSKVAQGEVKKTKSDFSIPSLLSPDKKISHQNEILKKSNVIEIPQIRPDISIFPKSITDRIEKLSTIQQEEIVNALPKALAQAVEIQFMKNISTSTSTVVKSDTKQMKHHYIEDILSMKTSVPKDSQNVKTPPVVKEVVSRTDKIINPKTVTATVEKVLPISENIKSKSPIIEFQSVDTDLFLIDPVTGMITDRNAISADECEVTEISTHDSKEIDSTVCKMPAEIIYLTKNTSAKVKEAKPSTSMKKEIAVFETTICNDSVEKTSTNLRAVRIKSSFDKYNIKPLELSKTVEKEDKSTLESYSNQNSKSSDATVPNEIKSIDGICVESTTYLKEGNINNNEGQVQVFNSPLEPAIQQDEVSSTQHSTIDDNSNSFPLESVCSKENEITNSEIILNKPGENLKSQKSQKTTIKIKNLKTQPIDNIFPIRNHKVIPDKKNEIDIPKKWGRKKSNKKSDITKDKTANLEDSHSTSNCEISKPKIVKFPENVKSNIVNSEKMELKDNFGKTKLLPVNTLRDLSEKTNTENLQQLSLKLIDQNIISEFALTPTNISELRTSDETKRIENSSVLTPRKTKIKNKVVANDANEVKNMARALIEKKLPQKNLIEAYSTGDSIESSILTGEQGKTSQSEYPIASPIRTCTEVLLERVTTRNVTISSGNEESDDDICLADMAKKRFENVIPSNEKIIDTTIESTLTKHIFINSKPNNDNPENNSSVLIYPNTKRAESKQKRKSKSKVSFVQDENEIKEKLLRSKTRSITKAESTTTQTDFDSTEILSENLDTEKVCEDVHASSAKNIKEFSQVSKKVKNRYETDISSPTNTRKSDRLGFTRNEISVEKINTINSVKLSENGHLIFKMQKEPDVSKVFEPVSNHSKNDFSNTSLNSKKSADKHSGFSSPSDSKIDNEVLEVDSCSIDQNKIDCSLESLKQNNEKLTIVKNPQSKSKKSKHKRNSYDVTDNLSFPKAKREESQNLDNNEMKINSEIKDNSNSKNSLENSLSTHLINYIQPSDIDTSQNLAKKEISSLELIDVVVKATSESTAEFENILTNADIITNVTTTEKLPFSKKKKNEKPNKIKINLSTPIINKLETETIEENIKDNFNNIDILTSKPSVEINSEPITIKLSNKIENDTFEIPQIDKIDASKSNAILEFDLQPFLISSNNYDLRKLHKVKKIDNKGNSRKKYLNNKCIPNPSEVVEEDIPLNEISMIYKDTKYDKIENLDLSGKTIEKSQIIQMGETENKSKLAKESKPKRKHSRKRCSSSSSSEDNVLSSFVSKDPSLPEMSPNVTSQNSSVNIDVENNKQIKIPPKVKSKRGRKPNQYNINLTISKSTSQNFESQTLYLENNKLDSNLLNASKVNCKSKPDVLQESSIYYKIDKNDIEDKNTMVMLKDNKNLYYNPAGNANLDVSNNHDMSINRRLLYFHAAKISNSDITIDSEIVKQMEIISPEYDNKNIGENLEENEQTITGIASQPKRELKLNLKIHHKKKKNSRKNSHKEAKNSEQPFDSEEFDYCNSIYEKVKNFSVGDVHAPKIDDQNENEMSVFTAKENLDIADHSKPANENKKKKKKSDHSRTACIVSDEYAANESKMEMYSSLLATHEKKKKTKSNNNSISFGNDCENDSITNSTTSIPDVDPYNFDMEQKETLIEPKRIENKKSKNKKENLLSYFGDDSDKSGTEIKMKIKNSGSYLKSNNTSSSKEEFRSHVDKHNKHDDYLSSESEIVRHSPVISIIKNKIAVKEIISMNRDNSNKKQHFHEIQGNSISQKNQSEHNNEFNETITETSQTSYERNYEFNEITNEISQTLEPENKPSKTALCAKQKTNSRLSEENKNPDKIITDVNNLKVSKKIKKKYKSMNKSDLPITDVNVENSSVDNISLKNTNLKDEFSTGENEKTFNILLKIPTENKSDTNLSNVVPFSSNPEQTTNFDKRSMSSIPNCIDKTDEMTILDPKIIANTNENLLQTTTANTAINDVDFQSKIKFKKSSKGVHDENITQKTKKGKKEHFSITSDHGDASQNKTPDDSSNTYQIDSSLCANVTEPTRIPESKNSSVLESISEFSGAKSEIPLIMTTEYCPEVEINHRIQIKENEISHYNMETLNPDQTNEMSNVKSSLTKDDFSIIYNDDSNISKSHVNMVDESNKDSSKILNSNLLDYDENDKAPIIQDKYLADYGMYMEKRPRKSTILAIKKISQTFKPDSSDTEDVSDSASNASRPTTKHSKKKSRKLKTDLPTNVEISPTVEVPTVPCVPEEIVEKSLPEPEIVVEIPKISPMNNSLYDDQKYQEFKADTYCSICKRKFRRPENLLKHKTTLMHISKLSEIEAHEIRNNVEIIVPPPVKMQSSNNYVPNELTNQFNDKHDVAIAKDSDNTKLIDNASSRPYKNVAERKSFDLEVLLNTSTTSSTFVHPDSGMESLGRKELSRDEALFFECCSLLKESDAPRKNITESTLFKTAKVQDKSGDINEKHKIKKVLNHNLNVDDVIENSDVPVATILPMHKDQFDDNCDSVLSSVSNESTSRNKCYLKMDCEYETEQCDLKNVNFESEKSSLNANTDLLPTNVSNLYKSKISQDTFCATKELTRFIYKIDSLSVKDGTDDVIEDSSYDVMRLSSNNSSDDTNNLTPIRESSKHSKSSKNKTKDDVKNKNITKDHIVELMPMNERSPVHYDVSHNEILLNSDLKKDKTVNAVDENNSSHDISRSTIAPSKKNNAKVELFSQIIEYEDKFDKIKRKAREKAQAAQEALSASMSPSIYTKSKKKTHSKSRKLSKSSDTSSKNSKISKNRCVPKKKTHTKELHKFENKKILTKGALKGFEGIKVSIPTQEMNLNILETAKSNLQDLADYALLSENISQNSDNNENVPSTPKDSYSKSSDKEFYNKCIKNKNQVSSSSKYRSTKNNSISSRNSQGHRQSDIYDFFDEDDDDDDGDEDNVEKNTKFPSPSNNSLQEKNSSNTKSNEKTSGEVHNEDSQISSLSFSDRDDFTYMSDDYNVNQSEDDTISKSSNSIEIQLANINKSARKNRISSQCKKLTKKSAIMGRIFKNNVIRNEQKLLNNDQLFDSLLEKSSASNIRNAPKSSTKLSLEYSESADCDNQSIDGDKLDNIGNTAASEAVSEFESEIDEESRSPIRTHQRKIVPRLKARSSDDEILNPKDSDKTENAILLETYQDNIGVASRKLQRKCTTGKQNVLAESWSSESDFEDFRQFEEYSSIPKPQRHHRRPRRSRRHCYSNDQKLLENQNIKPDTDIQTSFVHENINPSDDFHDKFYDDNLDNDDFPTDRNYKLCNDLSIRKDSDTEHDKNFDDGFSESKNPRIKSKRLMFSKRRVSFNSIKNPESRRRRKQSQKPFDYDDEFKPARIAEPLTTQKRNKRAASDKLYIWPSSSDEEMPNTAVDTSSRGPEPIKQHGWIVGDSHKKLVTMLAHAKGRKLDDNATVKEKKSRLQS